MPDPTAPVSQELPGLPDSVKQYIPEDPMHQALAAIGLMGLAGAGYRNFFPAENPRAAMNPREIRLLPPGYGEEKAASAKPPKDDEGLGSVARMGLGAALPIGGYGIYKAIEHYIERGDRERLSQQAEYLRRISDPAYKQHMQAQQVASMAQPQEGPGMEVAASADNVLDALGDILLTKLAEEKSTLGRAGDAAGSIMDLSLKALERYPEILGVTGGTAGLAAYLAARRNLLPDAHMGPPRDLDDPMLVTPRGHYMGQPQLRAV